jgi:alpha-1,3-rhamnosyltransferase
LLEAVGYFDEDMIADDLVLRTKTAKHVLEHPEYKIGVLKASAVNYRMHDTNVSRNLALQLKSIALFYQRYYPNKRRMRTLKNRFRGLLKQHKFKEAIDLYKEFSLYRDFTILIPLWLLGIGFNAICNRFKQKNKL